MEYLSEEAIERIEKDQKIRVHAFCCVLALMLLLLLKRKLLMAGIKLSLERMIEELSDVQLSVIKFYDVDKRLCLLNDLNEEQKAMFDVLDLMRYKKLVSQYKVTLALLYRSSQNT
jgi:transposase